MSPVSLLLSYSKTGNKKRATCFATLLRNELNSDVARFITDVRTCPATNKVARFSFVGGKKRNIAIQLVLQECCKTSYTFLVARFTVPLNKFNSTSPTSNCQHSGFQCDSDIKICLAGEQALLFGQAKRASRERTRERGAAASPPARAFSPDSFHSPK